MGQGEAAQAATPKPTPVPARVTEQERLEEKRDKIREELKEREQELSERLSQDKQEVAVRIAGKVNDVNQRLIDHYIRHLQRLDAIVNKIETRAERMQQQGADIEDVTAAIKHAREQIAAARKQVNVQKSTVYAVALAEADPLGTLISDMWQQFVSDQKELREGVLRDARKAVVEALTALQEVALPSVAPSP